MGAAIQLQQCRTRKIGVVIPGYGHPQFLNEALQDVLNQNNAQRLITVIVDDGCPYAETAAVPRHAMAALDQQVYYIRQKNAKLPAARNAGVRFLLKAHPEIEAIFFLDADNRLAPYAIDSYEAALFSGDTIGWAYPDIGFFGLVHNPLGFQIGETAPIYSVLRHLMGNISEAGSLVRASVFRDGLSFDENMRDGFEDWDFWLTLLEEGWVGQRASDSGFFYRRRPESMLSDSRRKEEVLIARLRAKHPQIFSLASIMNALHHEAPTFALIDYEEKSVHLTADPMLSGNTLTFDQFKAFCKTCRDYPDEVFAPSYVIAASHLFWLNASVTPQLRYSFWTLLEQAKDAGPRVIHVKDGGRHILQIRETESGVGARNLIGAPFKDFIHLMEMVHTPGQQWKQIHMLCPGYEPPRQRGFGDSREGVWIDALLPDLQIDQKRDSQLAYVDRSYTGPSPKDLQPVLLDEIMDTEGRAPYPFLGIDNPVVLVVIDIDNLNKPLVRESVTALITGLLQENMTIRLGLEISFSEDFPPDSFKAFNNIVADCVPIVRQKLVSEHRTYLGRRLTQDFSLRDKENALVLAQGADAVLCLGPCAIQSLLGELKSSGVKGFVYCDPPFVDEKVGTVSDTFGRLLAYEHAETGIVLKDDKLRAALGSEGIPPGKMMDLPRVIDAIKTAGSRRRLLKAS